MLTSIQSISLEHMPVVPGSFDTLLIDLGTTTVALCLIDRKEGQLRETKLISNPQKIFGNDVISRIRSAMRGRDKELQHQICHAIETETLLLCEKNHQSLSDIKDCYIGGNTTMIHLLMGYDCSPLASSPFSVRQCSPKPFLYNHCNVHIIPWISAFVGGDITAGIAACNLEFGTNLLMDLGTNGELILHHNGTWLATSTAAGPAFEGSGISCGCSAIPGAICNIELRPLGAKLTTIDNKLPVGICGSGILSLCSQLLQKKYITCDGILTKRFPKEGIVLGKTTQGKILTFTPEDFRQIQPAIAAVAAGVETLCREAGIHPSSLEQIYLGGGFGFYLDIPSCQRLGMFSSIQKQAILPMGNTCLQGLYIHATKELSSVPLPSVTHIELADNSYFKERFIHHMTYPA